LKILAVLGWIAIIIIFAFAGMIVGGLAGIVAGPVKAINWMNGSEEQSAPLNDSI